MMNKNQGTILTYEQAVEKAKNGTLETCPHLVGIRVFEAIYVNGARKYIIGKECNLPEGWEIYDLGNLSYVNMVNKEPQLVKTIDAYMDGDAGSCQEDCPYHKECNN